MEIMAKYKVNYTEQYTHVYIIDANSREEAEEKMAYAAENLGDLVDTCTDFDYWDVEAEREADGDDLECFDTLPEEYNGKKVNRMTFNKKESDILLKVKNNLTEMWDGKLKKYHIPLYIAHEIAHCYNEIVKNRKTFTICHDVKNFFEKRKFHIVVDGIGWKISL